MDVCTFQCLSVIHHINVRLFFFFFSCHVFPSAFIAVSCQSLRGSEAADGNHSTHSGLYNSLVSIPSSIFSLWGCKSRPPMSAWSKWSCTLKRHGRKFKYSMTKSRQRLTTGRENQSSAIWFFLKWSTKWPSLVWQRPSSGLECRWFCFMSLLTS